VELDGVAAGVLSELDLEDSDFAESELEDSDFGEECFPFDALLFPLA